MESLKTQNMNYILDNMEECIRDYDYINMFPPNIKLYMLKRFVSSMHYWKNVDFKKVLKALIMPGLEEINLRFADVDDEILEILINCPSLRQVYIRKRKGDYSVTTQGLIRFISSLKHLDLLQISHCDAVNDDVIRCIAENCPHLTALDISGCINVTDQGFERVDSLKDILWVSLSWTGPYSKGVHKLLSESGAVTNCQLSRLSDTSTEMAIITVRFRHRHARRALVYDNRCGNDDEVIARFVVSRYHELDAYSKKFVDVFFHQEKICNS